jgi:hypothetical protein
MLPSAPNISAFQQTTQSFPAVYCPLFQGSADSTSRRGDEHPTELSTVKKT